MRSAGELRPDVLMDLTGAIERFADLSPDQIQAPGIEIAILGQTGLNINAPEAADRFRIQDFHLTKNVGFAQFVPSPFSV